MGRLGRLVGVVALASVGALVAARRWSQRSRTTAPVGMPPLMASPAATALRSSDFGSPVLVCSHAVPVGEVVLQQLWRLRERTGSEVIRGTLVAEFVAGQRQSTLHVGFCPPLERLPAVEAEPCGGPDAEVKVVQAFAHGARLEVRLSEPAEVDCSVIVELSAKPI